MVRAMSSAVPAHAALLAVQIPTVRANMKAGVSENGVIAVQTPCFRHLAAVFTVDTAQHIFIYELIITTFGTFSDYVLCGRDKYV